MEYLIAYIVIGIIVVSGIGYAASRSPLAPEDE